MVHSGTVVIDNVPDMSGSNLANIHDVSSGHISLYQRNIDKLSGQKQYAYLLKAGYRHSFKTYTSAEHNVKFNYDGEFLQVHTIIRLVYLDIILTVAHLLIA